MYKLVKLNTSYVLYINIQLCCYNMHSAHKCRFSLNLKLVLTIIVFIVGKPNWNSMLVTLLVKAKERFNAFSVARVQSIKNSCAVVIP